MKEEAVRLNKYISDSGYCSRREADNYIVMGRVTVNGEEASVGSVVHPGDRVEVDGERVGKAAKRPLYMVFNKPVGVTSTTDKADKTNIIDFISHKERIFPVGRLDKDSEGLIFLTNDGDIVNKILRAGNNHSKEYVVTVDKPITPDFLTRMSRGVRILGVMTKPCKLVKQGETTFTIHLTQGLNRQIRRMCNALDYKVMKLKRVKMLNIGLGNLEPGYWRYFTPQETADMYRLLDESVGTEEASDQPVAQKLPYHKRPENRAGSYAAFRSKKSGSTFEGKSADKPGVKSEGRTDRKLAGKPDSKPAGKTGGARVAKPKSGASFGTFKKRR